MTTDRTRPTWVWIISSFLGCAAVSQFTSHTMILFSPELRNDQVQAVVDSWTFLDYISPYLLSSILLVAMIQLFRLKSIAYELFAIYLVFVVSMTIYQAVVTSWLGEFGVQGLLGALGGTAIMVAVFFYIRNLRATEILT